MEENVIKVVVDLQNDLKRSSNLYIHGLIHEIHATSDLLLDDDLSNDSPALKKLETQLKQLLNAFSVRMNIN